MARPLFPAAGIRPAVGRPQQEDTDVSSSRLGTADAGADLIARAVGAVALAALAMIHVIDLPDTLGVTARECASALGPEVALFHDAPVGPEAQQ
jgi:hypothetical protein